MQCLTRCAAALAVVAAALAAACAAGAYHLAGWLNDPDAPERAGAILVLGGDPSRALEAAELYRGALAPAVYIVAPFREPSLRRLDGAGVPSPREEELTRKALAARGVPEAAIALLGRDVASTAQEARLAAERLAGVPGTLIVVTSPYHIRRARMIFREALPGRPLRFVGNRYESLPDAWWRDPVSARNVVLELAKTAYYAVGGRF
jgi:uncharacterized SAM-binding protein YcdF (DUF218 family)